MRGRFQLRLILATYFVLFFDCALLQQLKIAKINLKTLILEVWGLSKSTTLIRLKSSSLVLIVIGSISIPICNPFDERLAKNGKITTFTVVPLFDPLLRRLP